MKKMAIAGAVLLLIVAISGPAVTGALTEDAWETLRLEFNAESHGVAHMETVDYDKGYFGSDVLTRISFTPPESEEPVQIYLRSEVTHGLTGARAETRLDEAHHPEWVAPFGDEVPRLITHAGLTGDVDGKLRIPEVATELAEGRLHSQPLRLDFAMTGDGNAASLALDWNGIEISTNEDDRGPLLQVGKVTLREDLSRLQGEVWVGNAAFSVALLGGHAPGKGGFLFEDLRVASETGEVEGDRLNSHMNFDIRHIEIDGEPFGEYHMQMLIKGVDIAAMDGVLTAMKQFGEAERIEDQGKRAARQVELYSNAMTELRNLMGRGVSASVPHMVLETPEGPFEMTLDFRHPQLEPAARENMLSLMQYSQGALHLSLPIALLEYADPKLQRQVRQLYLQGLLERKDGHLLLAITMEDMTLNVNGHPIPLPPII